MRKSINIDGYSHGVHPIPAASRVGPLIMTGGVHGIDPATGKLAEGLEDQVRLMFANLERIFASAGAGLKNVAKVTVYLRDPDTRPVVNKYWVEAFPDPDSRPARHTLHYDHLAPGMFVQCDATGWAADGE